jgi:hypothetical protein
MAAKSQRAERLIEVPGNEMLGIELQSRAIGVVPVDADDSFNAALGERGEQHPGAASDVDHRSNRENIEHERRNRRRGCAGVAHPFLEAPVARLIGFPQHLVELHRPTSRNATGQTRCGAFPSAAPISARMVEPRRERSCVDAPLNDPPRRTRCRARR